jgi:hypothetical protein
VVKLILFTMALLLLTAGCGQKSVIKTDIKATRTSEAFGDGKHTIIPIIIPLSDQSIAAFESPLKKMAFLRGFAKMFLDLGASLGLGKAQLSMIQPVPELPTEYLKSVTIKRLFLYIEPHADCRTSDDPESACRKEKLQRRFSWLKRIFKGYSNVDFKFLDKVAVKAYPRPMQNITNWLPMVDIKELSRSDFHPLQALFEEDQVINKQNSRELVLLKYSRKTKEQDTKPLGPIFILNIKEGESPAKTKNFLFDYPKFKGYFKRIHIMNKSLLVELKNDRITLESVENVLAENAQEIEDMGIETIEQCTETSCLDLNIPAVNLVPLIEKSNGIQIDSYIDVGKVPNGFQLKGFIEFEVKLDLPF